MENRVLSQPSKRDGQSNLDLIFPCGEGPPARLRLSLAFQNSLIKQRTEGFVAFVNVVTQITETG